MNDFNTVLEQFRSDLEAATNNQLVTRSYEDYDSGKRGDDRLRKGVWTIMTKGANEFNAPVNLTELEGKLNVIVLYQFTLSDKAKGVDIEKEEFNAYNTLINFLETATGTTRCFNVTAFQQSMQIQKPYGWIAISLTWEEFD